MIIIYDKGRGNFDMAALEAAKLVFGVDHVVQGVANPDQLPEAFSDYGNNYVVAHLSEAQWQLLCQNWPKQVSALIRVSSQGAGGMPSYGPAKESGNGRWTLHATQRADEITPPEWNEIFRAIAEWRFQSHKSPPLRLIDTLYKSHESVLAYRLLREAESICNGQNRVPNYNGTGLTIHAPTTMDEWLNPFDSNPDAALRTLARCIVDEDEDSGTNQAIDVRPMVSAKSPEELRDLKKIVQTFLKIRDSPQLHS